MIKIYLLPLNAAHSIEKAPGLHRKAQILFIRAVTSLQNKLNVEFLKLPLLFKILGSYRFLEEMQTCNLMLNGPRTNVVRNYLSYYMLLEKMHLRFREIVNMQIIKCFIGFMLKFKKK